MATSTVLAEILRSTRAEVARRREAHPLAELAAASREHRPRIGGRFQEALQAPGVGVIAEFKRRSPSAGVIREGAEVAQIVAAYGAGGACALSVLTEGPHFGGSLEDLRLARAATELPILRKDFVVDSYQLHEALVAGADAVLLIVAALTPASLSDLHGEARELGLDVLVEVHDRQELAIALEIGARTIGINNRDLRDFSVDPGRTARLMQAVPPGTTVVSESGIHEPAQLLELGTVGVQAVLVGESLMRRPDPRAALMVLRGM